MDAIIWALPWVVMAVILVEFALVEELPAPRVRRVTIGVGVFLLVVTALAVWRTPPLAPVPHLLVASGPLAYLLLAELLRRAVLRLKGGEPVLLFTAQAWQGRARRAFFEPDASRRVSGWDVVYTLLVGMAALLAMMPAMGEIVRRGGAG
jgi:hypothetical protein